MKSFRLSAFLFLCVSLACGQGRGPYPDRIPIGAVQGRVTASDDGEAHRSPLVGESVVVRGMVHQIVRWQASAGHSLYGIMIQDLPDEADGDPLSSDGLFVYTGGAPNLRLQDQGNHAISLGDILVLRGNVNERFGQTELADAVVLAAETGADLDERLPPTPLTLSDDLSETMRILERHEGMRVQLSAGAQAVSGSYPNERNRDFLVWITPSENPILQRERAVERRLFRGAHPLSNVPPERWLEGHGMRLPLGSLALKGRADDGDIRLPPLKTGTVFPEVLTGGVQYSFGSYVLQVEEMPQTRGGENPATWRLPTPEGSEDRVRIASYNLENLYDFIDDPHSDCDFEGNSGCPGVREPFNYLPKSDEEYRARLRILARHIVEDLASPQIIMVQEIENQDIGVLTPAGMVYGEENDADGELDSLQELAIKIVALGGPVYTTAVNRHGGDNRGIICATMYQADLLEPLHPEADHPVLGAEPQIRIDGAPFGMNNEVVNPKAFNYALDELADGEPGMVGVFSRPVQVFALREKREDGRTIWLLNNHFSAGPGRRVERRTAQARVNARIAEKLMALYPEDAVIVGGDLNVFPRPDDPLDPPSDQLGPLYDVGLFNVADRIMERDSANVYSYVFQGNANTLDHLFISPNLKEALAHATYVHLNADFPEGFRGEPPLRGSDHDVLLIELAD